jgi:hypothetical protein
LRLWRYRSLSASAPEQGEVHRNVGLLIVLNRPGIAGGYLV